MDNKLQNNNNGKEKTETKTVMVQRSISFSGPLPPPEVLKKFNEVVPGAAERIIKMAEGQFVHRVELEKKVINSDIDNSRLGLIFGFIIAIVGLIISFGLVVLGHQIVGTIFGGTTLLSLVSVFVYGTTSRKKERQQKNKEIQKSINSNEMQNVKDIEIS